MKYVVGPIYDKKILTINLPERPGQKILMSLSGGADSAILLYILAKLNKTSGTGHFIYPVTFPRDELAETFANNVINFINQKLNVSLPRTKIHGRSDLNHNEFIKNGITELMETGEYDCVYIAENKVPNIDMPGLAPIRADETYNYDKLYLPFSKFYKYHTLDLYFEENVEELLALTHSCTEQAYGRCNACFQDYERMWALKELDREDTGNI